MLNVLEHEWNKTNILYASDVTNDEDLSKLDVAQIVMPGKVILTFVKTCNR